MTKLGKVLRSRSFSKSVRPTIRSALNGDNWVSVIPERSY